MQVSNKKSYVNFYEKKKILGYKPKETIDTSTMMTQTLSEFIKTKELKHQQVMDESEYKSNSLEQYTDEFNDYKDYVNTHKLLLELDKINEEESTEEIDYTQEITQSDKDVNLN